MKISLNRNVPVAFVCLILTFFFNQYSWLFLFRSDGLLALWEILLLGTLDVFLLAAAIFFYINRNKDDSIIHFLKFVFFNSLLLIFGFVLLELLFGNWFNPNKINQLNIRKDIEIHFNLLGIYPSETDPIIYTRDQWGFRGNYPDVESIDILTIGGSTTDQLYISDGHTFQDILQNEFKKSGHNVFVVNAGIDGQSTFGHIKNFDWWFPNIPKLRVEYFLFFVGINDFYKDADFSFDDLRGESANTVKMAIKSRSALYNLYRTIEGVRLANAYGLDHDVGKRVRKFSTRDWVDEPRLSNYREIMKDKLFAYEQRLNILCEKVKSVGSIPIFVTQSRRRDYDVIGGRLYGNPSMGKYDGHLYNGVDYYHMIRLLHERTKKVSDDKGGIFIDLDNELVFDIKNDFYDSAHTTPSGAEKIGRYLHEKLNYLFE